MSCRSHWRIPTNPCFLDRSLLQRLDRTLTIFPRTRLPDRSADEKVVAGANLKEIDSLGDEELRRYLAEGTRIFRRISDLPCPSVPLVNAQLLEAGRTGPALHRDRGDQSEPSRVYPIGLPERGWACAPDGVNPEAARWSIWPRRSRPPPMGSLS